MPKHTIVLADDHRLVRQGIRCLIEAEPDFTVVGETGDGLEAVRLTEKLAPDVLVTDWMMPSLTGLEVVNQVRRRVPKTGIVLISMHGNESFVVESLRSGAGAYVLKDSTGEELVKAIREVVAGRKFLSAPFADRAIAAYLQKSNHTAVDPYQDLTPREREVLQLKAEGHTGAQIARRLFISPRTVEVHHTNMMRKLGLRSQTDLIRFALARGLLSPDMQFGDTRS